MNEQWTSEIRCNLQPLHHVVHLQRSKRFIEVHLQSNRFTCQLAYTASVVQCSRQIQAIVTTSSSFGTLHTTFLTHPVQSLHWHTTFLTHPVQSLPWHTTFLTHPVQSLPWHTAHNISHSPCTITAVFCTIEVKIDWLIQLRFYVPPDTKQVILKTAFQSISWLTSSTWKLTQQKQTCIRNKIYYNTWQRSCKLKRGSTPLAQSSATVLYEDQSVTFWLTQV